MDEEKLARIFARALPVVTLLGAIAVGWTMNVATALLVVASGVFVAIIALFWSSIRTLGGETEVDRELLLSSEMGATLDARERKNALLRSIKDLEHEHAVGKIGDADFEALTRHYRDEAKNVLRELDAAVDPLRPEAERIAREHLSTLGIAAKVEP
jgi:hypothetical protein